MLNIWNWLFEKNDKEIGWSDIKEKLEEIKDLKIWRDRLINNSLNGTSLGSSQDEISETEEKIEELEKSVQSMREYKFSGN